MAMMKLASREFKNLEAVPTKFTCDGEDINPELDISEVPEKARSLVLIMDDPDAPGGTWVHWLLWNIPPDTEIIEEGTIPLGATEGTNSSGRVGYHGPCPPEGAHHYFFKLYALDTTLDLPSSTKHNDLVEAMENHLLDQTSLVGIYART